MKNAIQKAWSGRNGLACILWPVSLVYRFAICVRRYLYKADILKSASMPVPVIVVGNVVAGGGGKTPLVIALVQHLKHDGWQVGVISRGYGRQSHRCQEVHISTHVNESGDEPLLIKRRTGAPVFVGIKRVSAAKALLQAYPGTHILVCDDGLQHYALRRDIEIIVFDDRGTGSGWVLPAGPLREPWPAVAAMVPRILLHTGNKPAFGGFTSTRRLAENAVALDGTLVPMVNFGGKPVIALAAIANPQAFFDMLGLSGILLSDTVALPDHHRVSEADLPGRVDATILCTEKDAVKLVASPRTANVLAVPLEFEPEQAFFTALDALLYPLLSQLPLGNGTKIA